MNRVSPCCQSSIVQGTKKHYPLGGTVWSESYIVDVCEACGKEAEYTLLQDEETGEIVGASA